MKTILITIIVVLGVGMWFVLDAANNTRVQTLKAQKEINAYQDSIGRARAKLLIIRIDVATQSSDATDLFKEQDESVKARMALHKQIWGWKWKIDSIKAVQ